MEKTVHRPGSAKIYDRSQQAAGFTLVELSIVLVIIGLLVGAIVVGSDMIQAAAIRAQIKQIDQFNTAVHVFRMRYNYLPGDIPAPVAAQFGFTARSGAVGHGDGNGTLLGGSNFSGFCGEISMFWNDLSASSIVPGNFSGADTGAGGSGAGSCAVGNTAAILPLSALGNADFVTVYGDPITGKNYWQLFGMWGGTGGGGNYNGGTYLNITPIAAQTIDTKIDDGMPLTGNVTFSWISSGSSTSIPSTANVTPAAPAVGVCVSNAAGNPYNINASTGGNSGACSLSIGFN